MNIKRQILISFSLSSLVLHSITVLAAQDLNPNNFDDLKAHLAAYRAQLPIEAVTVALDERQLHTVQLTADELLALEARNLLGSPVSHIAHNFNENNCRLNLKTGVPWLASAALISGLAARHFYRTYQADSFNQKPFWLKLLKLAGAAVVVDTTISVWSLHERRKLYQQKEVQIAARLTQLDIAPVDVQRAQQKIETLVLQHDTRLRCLQQILDETGFKDLRLYWEQH